MRKDVHAIAPRFAAALRAKLPFVIAFAGAAVVGATGCGSESSNGSYYCDGDGCYECDGYGCSPVSATPKATCTGTSTCPSGFLCTTAGCSKTCIANAECLRGEVCKTGVCAPPKEQPGVSKECTTKTDCGDGKTCVGSACVPKSEVCSFSSECDDGRICADGACLAACSATSACEGTAVCDKGVCRPGVDPGDAGVPDTRPKPNCDTDLECGGGETAKMCIGGYCRYTCQTDDTCRLIDTRIGFCAADGVCRTENEANPECTIDAPCEGGKSCIDNRCK